MPKNLMKTVFAVMVINLWVFVPMQAFAGDIVVIANPELRVDSLTKSDVAQIFLAKKKMVAGETVKVVVSRVSATHEAFLDKYIGKTPYQFNS